jgi:3-oxoadipate enol-lactonase
MPETVKLNSSGAGRGTPIVLLHGFPLNSTIWTQQRQELASNYRVITPDLRGHGHSPFPAGVYDMDLLARDVLALLDSLDIARAVIMGHSLGGYVTLAAWRLAPERFLALGLIDSHAAADTEVGRNGRLQLAEKVAAKGSQAAADALLPKLFAPGLAAGNPTWEQVRSMILKTPRPGIIGSLKGMAVRPDSSAMLNTIEVPAIVVVGDKEQIITPDKTEALLAAIPNSALKVIPDAGHVPMLEQPAAMTAAIQEFLHSAGL